MLKITGELDRKGPDAFEEISDAARERWRKRGDYRPETLRHFYGQLSE
jgi:hypothetical protein